MHRRLVKKESEPDALITVGDEIGKFYTGI